MNEDSPAKFNSNAINGIVILFYKNLLSGSPNRFTNAMLLCRTLAIRLNEDGFVRELYQIDKTSVGGYPLAIVEATHSKGVALGYPMAKTYNYGFQNPRMNLGDMTLALNSSMNRIFDIFTKMCVKHDIDTTFVMPIVDEVKEGEMGL